MVVRGATVVDSSGVRRADVAIDDREIVAVESSIDAAGGRRVVDASGCLVLPGLVDLHAHLRDPGNPECETVESASRAAARGGYTAVVAMPNTDPPIDSVEVVRYVQERATRAMTEVAVAGTITAGRKGERLAPMGEMFEAGVRLFTDDGAGVQDALLMRRAMEYAGGLGAIIAEHCEEARLAYRGHMHEGRWSSFLGIPGIPAEAEEVMAARDIALSRLTGCRLHLLHISTTGTLDLVRKAFKAGLPVTGEVAPHHLSLSDAEVASYDPQFKVNPPLRPAEDVRSLVNALVSGEVVVATDHAPHPADSKELPFDQAPPGMLGLETALGVVWTVLTSGSGLSTGLDDMPVLSFEEAAAVVVEAMSVVPARIAGLEGAQGGTVRAGSAANLCVFDPAATWVVDRNRLASLSANTPYDGRKLTGRVRHTIFRGEPVVVDGEPLR